MGLEKPAITRRDFQQLERDLAEFAHWKDRRDELIRRGLAAGMGIERLASVMSLSPTTVRRVKDEGH
jgi:hypothetical protein